MNNICANFHHLTLFRSTSILFPTDGRTLLDCPRILSGPRFCNFSQLVTYGITNLNLIHFFIYRGYNNCKLKSLIKILNIHETIHLHLKISMSFISETFSNITMTLLGIYAILFFYLNYK